ncbi:Nicotinate-nucleotide adenylyltransferase [Polystyrenella longa]|uniref:Probable nicotinate-nucleotide adenylyltransferase n=1 Tax=Polystyrenella longa TaxID=2528007 RepID=A0A518CJU0_9PLAN|nr:nicotinate-nucleotide adenylyltransferase [Polystyrenella longa]QDU79496.1 Nicotinate-nucleotide adenylyltransferase [Polystyrenella longa]
MRLGLLGGTFDPVHLGHLIMAEACREACQLEEIWFIPTGKPPHKVTAEITDSRKRIEMLEMALAGAREFKISDREVKRSGTTYTVDTLTQLKEEEPSRDLYFIIGADSLHDFPTWREPERIAELATILVVNRSGKIMPEVATLPEKIRNSIQMVTIPDIGIASSDLRQRVGEGKSIRFQVPRSVDVYIKQHDLYTASSETE